jgi:hypothetical protein
MFDGALAWSLGGIHSVTFNGREESVDGQFVSGDFFSTLGVSALYPFGVSPSRVPAASWHNGGKHRFLWPTRLTRNTGP